MNPPRPNEADEIMNQRIDNIRMNIPRDFKARLNEGIDVDLIEKLAAIEHERWSAWWIHSVKNETVENVTRWNRQAITPYERLPESEKESDRKEVRRYLPLIKELIAETEAVVTKRERELALSVVRTEEIPKSDDFPKEQEKIFLVSPAHSMIGAVVATKNNIEKRLLAAYESNDAGERQHG